MGPLWVHIGWDLFETNTECVDEPFSWFTARFSGDSYQAVPDTSPCVSLLPFIITLYAWAHLMTLKHTAESKY